MTAFTRISVIFALAALLCACDQPTADTEIKDQVVRVVEARQQRLNHRLSFHGVLMPVVRAQLAFQSPGVLATRPARIGQVVRQGELLATLDNPELGPAQRASAARVQESLALRDQAKRDLARLRSLSETGAVGEEQVEQKLAELDTFIAAVERAEADLAGTRQRLDDATLLAPFDGVISQVSAEPGEFVSAGQPIMSIGGLERVEVRVLVPASLVSALREGDLIGVRVPQLGANEYQGEVTELSAIGEVETGLFPVIVELQVDPTSTMIRAGMQAEVLVDYADVEGLVVPLSAVVDPVGNGPSIYRVQDGRVYEVPVKVVASANEQVALQVLAGILQDGDEVVIAGHRSLTDGQPVRTAR